MFHISDFWNIREFIVKLNKIFSFDGKFSSLEDIPAKFKPEEHTHPEVTINSPSGNTGFISKETYEKLAESCTFFRSKDGVLYNDFGCFESMEGGIFLALSRMSSIIEEFSIDVTRNATNFDIKVNPFAYNVISIYLMDITPPAIFLYPHFIPAPDPGSVFFDNYKFGYENLINFFQEGKKEIYVPVSFRVYHGVYRSMAQSSMIYLSNEIIDKTKICPDTTIGLENRFNDVCVLTNKNNDLYVTEKSYSNAAIPLFEIDYLYKSQNPSNYNTTTPRLITIETIWKITPGIPTIKMYILHVS